MDSINPFEQFGNELGSALPAKEEDFGVGGSSAPLPDEVAVDGPKTFDLTPKSSFEAPAKKPIMQPPRPPQGMYMNNGAGMMGGYPSAGNGMPMMGGGYQQPQWGQQPPQQPMQQMQQPPQQSTQPQMQPQQPYNQGPPAPYTAGSQAPRGAIVPSNAPKNYGADLMGGAPRRTPFDPISTAPANPPYGQPTPATSGAMVPSTNPTNVGDDLLGFSAPSNPGSAVTSPSGQPAPMGTNTGGGLLGDPFDFSPPPPKMQEVEASMGQWAQQDPTTHATPPPPAGQPPAPPSEVVVDDPFGVFSSGAAPPKTPPPPPAGTVLSPATSAGTHDVDDDDFFGIFSNKPKEVPAQVPAQVPAVVSAPQQEPVKAPPAEAAKKAPDAAPAETSEPPPGVEGMPAGGRYYEASIHAATIGVVFREVGKMKHTLYSAADEETLEKLGDRPAVAYMTQNSVAAGNGVEMGHVVLKVNGKDVDDPDDATDSIISGGRPVSLSFYVPDVPVTVFEGSHMVKYDDHQKLAPLHAEDWKPKYVVVGGVIGEKWMLKMYRSRAEYDIAVMETLDHRPLTVKVKQFGLYQGTRIICNYNGKEIKTVKYNNTHKTWYYFIVKSPSCYPIKISSTTLEKLKPVHEGVRRIIAQQHAERDSKLRGGK